jgi:hypothetical protein
MRNASWALVLALASALLGRGQATNAPSVLPPEGFNFTGNWDCVGSFRNSKLHKASFTGAIILDGKWLELTEKDVEPATGYVAKYLIGYDPQQKRFVEFDANNFGAATYSSAEGWQNRVLIMTSPIFDDGKSGYVANRFQYSISAAGTFNVDWQISKTAVLAWVTADHLACTHQPGK